MSERAVRTFSFQIVNFAGDHVATKARWLSLSDKCREMANAIWQTWEAWHVNNGSPGELRAYAETRRAWHEAKKKKPKAKPPKPPKVTAVSPALAKSIRKTLAEGWPAVHSRIRELLLNSICKKMTGKDSEGRWQMWQAVLLSRQGRPSAEHSLPIPFDKQSGEISKGSDGFALSVNLTRIPRKGKLATSIEDHCCLKAKGSGYAILSRVVSGEYDFCGSSIVYHRSKRKWFALIAYRLPKVEKLVTGDKVARLFPGRDVPFVFSVGGNIQELHDIGYVAKSAREAVLGQRWSRNRGYRYGGPSDKGHGRKRALARVDKLSLRWKDTCKTANNQLTKHIVDLCIQRGVGTLVWYQPLGDKKDTRYMSRVGKQGDARFDQSDWEYAQITTMLQNKCQLAGIELKVERIGKQSKAA